MEKREKQMKMDSAVDDIRRRFGFYSIQRGLMYRDRILSAVNAKEEHTRSLFRSGRRRTYRLHLMTLLSVQIKKYGGKVLVVTNGRQALRLVPMERNARYVPVRE